MTTNHTELCERLISDIGKAILGEGTESLALVLSRCAALLQSQAARIQQQALDYVSLQAQCDEHLARIAELEKALKGLSSMYTFAWDVVDGGLFMSQDGKLRFEDAHKEARRVLGVELMEVDENGELTPEHEERTKLAARIAELEKERDALKADAERHVWSISSTDNAEFLWAAVMSCGPSARESINIEIAAALQAEKETRS